MSIGNIETNQWGKNASAFLGNLVAGKQQGTALLSRSMGGFVFSVLEETRLELKNNITTHYTENGNAIQQNISNQPKHVRLKGFILELELKKSELTSYTRDILHNIDKKFSVVDNVMGEHIPPTMKRVYNKAQDATNEYLNKIEQVEKGANNFLSVFGNANTNNSNVEQAYNKLIALWESRSTFTVVGYHNNTYPNMVIVSLYTTQTGNIQNQLELMIELQEIKTVSTKQKTLSQTEVTNIKRYSPILTKTNVKKKEKV